LFFANLEDHQATEIISRAIDAFPDIPTMFCIHQFWAVNQNQRYQHIDQSLEAGM
jgi:hypothetical protein